MTHARIRGCLLGGAIGDALGAPTEFLSLADIRARWGSHGVTGFEPAYGRRGALTDDTQMTLFTAEGLLRAQARGESRGIAHVPTMLWHAYLRWLETQGTPVEVPGPEGWLAAQPVLHSRRAPGNTCLGALLSGEMGTLDAPLNDSKGCGGVMRIAPIGLVTENAFELAAQAAVITHGHPSGYLSAGAGAHLIARLMRGDTLEDAARSALEELERWPGHEETTRAMESAIALAADGDPSPERLETLGAGWVGEEALAMSVYCALVAEDFRSGVLLAANHTGDSDSTGAITGNLLGALWGEEVLPEQWLEDLEGRALIEQLADDLASVFVDGSEPAPERYPAG